MSNQTFAREYECYGCGPMGESHKHTITVDFAYTSMTVAVDRGKEYDRVVYSWEEWAALREIAREEHRKEPPRST